MSEPRSSGLSEWKDLASKPVAAARELRRRVSERLSPAQQRAAIAWLPHEAQLSAAFAASPAGSPLHGVPYLLKDLFDLAGTRTFAGSTFLPEVRAARPGDCAIVQALRRAGAVCAGKTHLHEFACGNTGENPHYGDCEHPLRPGHLAGGSSSGSAAVVAAGIVPLAIGTDTGGSIRGPAAFCGVFGMRLAPHHPWIADALPVAPSCDTAGWFTATAADMRSVNLALLGLGTLQRPLNGAYLEYGRLDPEVAEACGRAARTLCEPADAETTRGLASIFRGSEDTYTALTGIEVAEVHRAWLDSHRARYSPAVWERIDRGRHVTPDERHRAEAHRTVLRATLASYFLTFDYLVLPAVAMPALTKAQCTPDNRRRLLELSAPATLAALPVLTIPVPLPSGLTAGLQIVVPSVVSPAIPWVLMETTNAH